MSTGVQPNETPRSSKTSVHSSTLSPPWQPPKTPLAPHRLAKLANALGVSAPIPASLNGPLGSPAFLSRTFSDSSGPPDHFRRSPTPSATSSMGHATPVSSTSKFLLHVIPPTHLPHDSDVSNDSDMTPPPPNASGYHTQFRRGTLVPVHPTLQGQLGAIAKEYALPSTAGLVLFLVSSGTAGSMQTPVSTGTKSPLLDDPFHEPGPRLSEGIWRHLWTRVVQAEQRDGNMLLPPRSPTPLTLSTHSTPFLHQQDLQGNLRPPPSPGMSPISPRPGYGFGITSSPPESISDSLRSNSKSAPPSSATQSEFDSNTPDTSVEGLAIRSDSLDLPGLDSPSLIPILAKVEFDIDRRKANWYEPWLRSRRANHAKRARSRKSSAKSTTTEDVPADKEKERFPAIPLIIGRKETASPPGLEASDPSKESGIEGDDEEAPQEVGYEPLSDSQEGGSDFDGEEDDFAEDSTARVSSTVEEDMKDPLEDVFGSDADTWSDLKQERRATHELNPNVVDLALSAGDLTVTSLDADEDEHDTSRFTTKEEEEVRDLLDRMSRSSGSSTPELDAQFSPPTSLRKVPPPLVIPPNANLGNVIAAEPSPFPTTAGLAYLDSSPDTGEQLSAPEEDIRPKSSADSEKRSGALFEDIDLGLDPTADYDENDPYDRRRSQIMMSAQLDEIEKTLAQLSPRFMKPDLDDDINHSFHSVSLNSPSKLTLSPLRSADTSLVSAQLPKHSDQLDDSQPGASWPAVPFSHIKEVSSPPTNTSGLSQVPGPPQLALNGVTTAAPPSFSALATSGETSAETVRRKKELEEEEALFRKPSTSDSPVIPLSPDPFGRFSSSTPDLQPPRIAEPPDGWDTVTVGQSSVTGDGENGRTGRARSGTTSRFSIDSIPEGEGHAAQAPAKSNRGTLMSVKSIKNLWRKSNKNDKEKAVEKDKGASSGRISPAAPQRPERPSQETMDLPDVPPMPVSTSFGRVSPQPGATPDMVRRPSQDVSNMPRAPSSQGSRPSLDHSQRPSSELPPPRPSQDAPPPSVPGPPMMAPGLAAPPYASIIRSSSPIVPTQMMGARQNYGLDRLQFDQESPYPNPVRNPPPARYIQQAPPSPPLPSSAPPNMQPQMHQQQQHYPGLPSIPEQEKLARKSILKWNSTSSNGSHNYPQQQQDRKQRMSFDRASNGSSRTNGSLRSVGSGSGGSYGHGAGVGRKTSVNSVSSDLAPSMGMSSSYDGAGPLRSPTIPELGTSPPYQRHLDARSVSPAPSYASSHASIDESQFEIVSPKLQGGMAYPSVSHGSGGLAS